MSTVRQGVQLVAAPAWRTWPLARLGYMLVALFAVLPRVIGLGQFVTVDEFDHWIARSEQFLAALRSGDVAATVITAHPGVTTMWLGSAGLLLHEGAVQWGLVPAGSFAAKLALMQLPVALANAGGVVLGYYLLRRLLPQPIAIGAALLWAADPFVIGYSRVLHVDALAGTFLTLSLLAACAYWHHTPHGWLLALSGCCAGLALLSKTPAAVVLPLVAAIALTARPPRSALATLAVWAVCCGLTIAVLWPAVLVAPLQVYDLLRTGVEENGAQPHSNGNFFLGQSDPAPGPLFYPVALALRSTPWTLLGLLLLPLALRRLAPPERRDVAALAALAIVLVVGLSLFPKKHNRYLEPAFPAVDILAAAGLVGVVGAAGRGRAAAGFVGVVGVAAGLNAAFWHPYGIAAFNQLLGGAPAGAHTFLIGWGEGLEQAASWINQQPDTGEQVVGATAKEGLAPYLHPGVRLMTPQKDIPAATRYMVVYARNVQDGPPDPPFDQFYGRVAPVYVVDIHGVPYAWVYQVAPAVAHAAPADFGDAVHLRGYAFDPLPGSAGLYNLKLFWQTLRAASTDYAAFVHLIGPDGQRYAQIDPHLPTSRLDAQRFSTTELQLQLPPGAPPGVYQLLVGLYDPTSGERLALTQHPPAEPALDGPHVVLLETFQYSP